MANAAEYATLGMALVAIPLGKKSPTTLGWNAQHNAITDPEAAGEVRENLGILHAYCSPSPTMALDLDDMVLAAPWLWKRGIDVVELLNADDAVQIVSGRPGRAKLLYRMPSGITPLESVTVTDKVSGGCTERWATILEFRCGTRDGQTVQDVLPPSIHPDTGLPYQWGGKGSWRNIPTIPIALLNVWQRELAARAMVDSRRKGRLHMFKGVDDTPRQRARVADMLRNISADCSYELYRDIVWALLSLGWRDAEEIAEQWAKTAPHRFEEKSFNDLVAGYDETRTPTIGTIHHHARAGGWNG